ncbi:MAG: crotonobetainyl-CoA--carnitine CoA-transferase [Sphingobacteriaceae bacterium]|nr:MAG: crotonobetainyl-CoA--carnitine CoA-transferase [Sphingobacteriaceae bacterium]
MGLVAHAQTADTVANNLQKQVINRGYGLFIHFGINTFNQIEWSDGTLPVSSYNPTALNCDKWIADAKEAGARHIVLTVKHHDGFCLWDSKFTDYDVASSPVKTDVVKAVADACKKYNVKFGIYYSLWDRHEKSYSDTDKQLYVTYMINQLTELLTNYGPVCELWFDGAWDRKAEDWNIPALYELTKKLQPACAFTVNHTIGVGQDTTQIGLPKDFKKGDAIRFFPIDFRTKDPNFARLDDPKIYNYKGTPHYLPFEHTICLSDRWNWFQKKEILPARPVDELEQIFYWCTANDNVLLINYPPDQTGVHRENERRRLFELANRLGIRGGNKPLPAAPKNIVLSQPVTSSSDIKGHEADKANDTDMESYWMAADKTADLEITLDKMQSFNCVTLLEFADMKGQPDGFSTLRDFRVKAFAIEILNNGLWKQVHKGAEIGSCLTINLLKEIKAEKLRIKIRDATQPAGFYHVIVNSSKKQNKLKRLTRE